MEKTLIQKVKENDVIYNAHSTYYRDTEMRQRTWEKIGKELNIKAEEAKSTWDKLRRCFVNASNRRRSKEHERGIVIHPWKYEKDMSFLWPFVERNRRTVDYPKSEGNKTSENSDSESETFERLINPEITNEPGENIKNELEEMPDYPSPLASFTYNLGKDEMAMSIRDNGANKRDYPNDDDSEGRHSHKRRCSSQQPQMDGCDMFFMSMSKMTKSLSDLEQAKIKLAISNLVLQAVISLHEKDTSTTNCTTINNLSSNGVERDG